MCIYFSMPLQWLLKVSVSSHYKPYNVALNVCKWMLRTGNFYMKRWTNMYHDAKTGVSLYTKVVWYANSNPVNKWIVVFHSFLVWIVLQALEMYFLGLAGQL